MVDPRAHRNMAGWDRALSVGAGAALLAYGWRHRFMRGAAASTGISLVARGVTGFCPAYAATGIRSRRDTPEQALSGRRGIHLRDGITIARPPGAVFRFWRNLDNLPLVITGLERIEPLDDERSRWTFRGPAGALVHWDAVTINVVPDELIAWKSLPGADVASAGSVTFKASRRGGTDVTVSMQYAPPAGRLGSAVAWMVGWAPASELREDLRQLKRMLEYGETSAADGRPASAREPRFGVVDPITS